MTAPGIRQEVTLDSEATGYRLNIVAYSTLSTYALLDDRSIR